MSGSVLFPNSATPAAENQPVFGYRPSSGLASSPMFRSPSEQKKPDCWGYSGQPISTPVPSSFRDPSASAAGDPGSFTPIFGPPVPAPSTSNSLFFRDLNATPATRTPSAGSDPPGTRGNFTAAAAAAFWREDNAGPVEPPPPPCFTLEDQIDTTPEAFPPSQPSHPYLQSAPLSSSFSAPRPNTFSASRSYGVRLAFADASPVEAQSPASPLQWMGSPAVGPPGATPWHSLRPAWSPSGGSMLGSGGRTVGPGGALATPSNVSPLGGPMVDETSLLTLQSADQVVRAPRIQRTEGEAEECWVTLYGFGPDDANVVLREFEKCGRILRQQFGPGGSNWMHVLYATPYDAQRALAKNGLQVSGQLMVAVKRTDPDQVGALSANGRGDVGGGEKRLGGITTTPVASANASRPYYVDGRAGGQGGVAQPKQNVVSHFVSWLVNM